ncbi:hypothetical protein [Rosistilla oblonga]|uniref:Uncharacterized protein n=1 Tax=Rosistilla oblonga TaxID=2527990 RepID=A0A518IMV9_9BACT|nr:hypothetical protein [Rosistilla oblonga]QDV54415.1 hypothetical protein Mal33_03690 [Rosistilla oblonga]
MSAGSLCERCAHVREIVSGKGSRFLMCRRGLASDQFAKYPPQPTLVCVGFESRGDGNEKGEHVF